MENVPVSAETRYVHSAGCNVKRLDSEHEDPLSELARNSSIVIDLMYLLGTSNTT